MRLDVNVFDSTSFGGATGSSLDLTPEAHTSQDSGRGHSNDDPKSTAPPEGRLWGEVVWGTVTVDRCSQELFLASCGLSGPLRLDLEEQSGTHSRFFEVPFVVVGRDPRADLVVDHPTVSRRQVYLQVISGQIFYVNIGSQRGLDSEPEQARQGWFAEPLGICVGPIQVHAGGGLSGPALGDALSSRSLDHSPLPGVILEFPQQANRPSWKLSRVLTLLGRTPECRLRFLDPEISKFHCSLLRTPSGVWVVDLLGRTGISLNGLPIRWAQLKDCDELQVGRHLIRVRCAMPTTSLSLSPPKPVGPATIVKPEPERAATLLEIGNDQPQALPGYTSNELVQSIMATMANQFGQLQQQMFEQFQQAMLMMAETFGTLHRDQMAQVRDELDQLRRVNQDLLALQAQANRSIPAPSSAPLPPISSIHGQVATEKALAQIEALVQTTLAAADISPSSGGTIPFAKEDSEDELPPSKTLDGQRLPTVANGTRPRDATSASKPPGSLSPGSGGDQGAVSYNRLPSDQIHSLLCRRMAKLQQERQSRWQRICDLMLGR